MTRDFGKTDATFTEAFESNPRALKEHLAWNVYLIPAGLQLALFGQHAGPFTPSFSWTRSNRSIATWASLLLVSVWITGTVLLMRRGQFHWQEGRFRKWSWVTLLCCVPSCVVGILIERPRPSYFFPLSLLLMAFTGVTLKALVRRLEIRGQYPEILASILGVLVLCFGLVFASRLLPIRDTPTLEEYWQLRRFKGIFQEPGRVIFANLKGFEVTNYFGACGEMSLRSRLSMRVSAALDSGFGFQEALTANGINLVCISGEFLDVPSVRDWRSNPEKNGWRRLAQSTSPSPRWELFAKSME